MSSITCLTLTAQPFEHVLPRNIAYKNYISKFDNAEGLHKARLQAIFTVKTKYFFFQDDDDPLPNYYPVPQRGIVYGNFLFNDIRSKERVKLDAQPWSEDWHVKNPLLIHKAFCNTAMARAVASLLPEGEYLTEYLLYYFLCKFYGFTFDPSLEMIWNKHPKGMHTKASKSIKNSVTWVNDNQEYVLSRLPRE